VQVYLFDELLIRIIFGGNNHSARINDNYALQRGIVLFAYKIIPLVRLALAPDNVRDRLRATQFKEFGQNDARFSRSCNTIKNKLARLRHGKRPRSRRV